MEGIWVAKTCWSKCKWVGVVGGTAESWMDLAAPGLVAQTGEKCAAEDSTEFGWHVF